jgi:hypothetical protein
MHPVNAGYFVEGCGSNSGLIIICVAWGSLIAPSCVLALISNCSNTDYEHLQSSLANLNKAHSIKSTNPNINNSFWSISICR